MSELQSILQEVCLRLIEEGRLSRIDYEQALKILEHDDGGLDDILVGMGILSEEALQKAIAEYLGCRFMNAEEIKEQCAQHVDLLDRFLATFIQEHVFLPLFLDPQTQELHIVASRLPSQAFLEHLKQLANVSSVSFDLSTRSIIASLIYQHYFPNSSRKLSHRSEKIHPMPSQEKEEGIECPSCGFLSPSDSLVCEQCGEPLRDELKEHYLQKGTTVGPFRIERLLGCGGMAEVYLAIDLRSNTQVALKTLHSQLSSMRTAIQRFQQEARTLKQLDHPGIVRFYEFGFQEKIGMYIATEYLEGREFLELLQEGKPVPLERLEGVVAQVCDALEYAHQHDVIHRDLKPDNIILLNEKNEGKEHVKLIDFGIAKILDDSMVRTQTGLVLGTPRYMSPEQVANKPFDHRADIYSLAVILFEALTNQCLFEADDGYQMMMQQLYTTPPLISDIRPELHYPEDLVFLIDQALSKEPEERPASMAEFKMRFLNTVQQYKLALNTYESSPHSPLELLDTLTEYPEEVLEQLESTAPSSDSIFDDLSTTDLDLEESTMVNMEPPTPDFPETKKKNLQTQAISLSELVPIESLIEETSEKMLPTSTPENNIVDLKDVFWDSHDDFQENDYLNTPEKAMEEDLFSGDDLPLPFDERTKRKRILPTAVPLSFQENLPNTSEQLDGSLQNESKNRAGYQNTEEKLEILELEEEVEDWKDSSLFQHQKTDPTVQPREEPKRSSLASLSEALDQGFERPLSSPKKKPILHSREEKKKMPLTSKRSAVPSVGISPIPPLDLSNERKKKRKKKVASAAIHFAGAVRLAIYMIVIGTLLYFAWVFYNSLEDDEQGFPKEKAPLIVPLNTPTHVKHRSGRKKHQKTGKFVCDGHWERQYRPYWVWNKRKKEFVSRRKWVKVCIPRKKKKKKDDF